MGMYDYLKNCTQMLNCFIAQLLPVYQNMASSQLVFEEMRNYEDVRDISLISRGVIYNGRSKVHSSIYRVFSNNLFQLLS